MSKDIWVGKKGLRFWYYRYRDSEYLSLGIIAGIVAVCIALVVWVILPQLTSWFSIRDEIIATRTRIETLERNISFMNTLDRATTDAQLQTASTALPAEKDFNTMLDVLAQSALIAGVSLNDFSFQVGNVSSSKGTTTDSRYRDLASIRITLVVVGDMNNIRRFVSSVENSVPVTEVVNIDGSDKTVAVTLQFFQKSFPEIKIDDTKPLAPISEKKVALLEKLDTWKKAPVYQGDFTPQGTNSAVPLF